MTVSAKFLLLAVDFVSVCLQVMDKGNTLLGHDHLKKIVLLCVNRDFMIHMRENHRDVMQQMALSLMRGDTLAGIRPSKERAQQAQAHNSIGAQTLPTKQAPQLGVRSCWGHGRVALEWRWVTAGSSARVVAGSGQGQGHGIVNAHGSGRGSGLLLLPLGHRGSGHAFPLTQEGWWF